MKINEQALIKLPLAVSMHTKLYELKNIKLEVINDKYKRTVYTASNSLLTV